MKVGIPKERLKHETRAAATPETVKKLKALGLDVVVEKGAGETARLADALYADAGATLAGSFKETVADADLVLKVRAPGAGELADMKKGAVLIATLDPYRDPDGVRAYAAAGVDAFAMELMPRITRAQSMDVLSSQANLAGYKAVLDAAAHFPKAMPMMMTAAGTIAPAKVFVMGAGVAGLQAIATARRLGAVVSATDVRPAAKEQVESLGASFVMVESEETKEAETAGGYAKEMSEEYKRKQAELIAETIKKQDIVICTALIPGRPAPVLVSEDMVKTMKPGAIIVDLAVENGGNCPLSKLGEVIEAHGVTILGYANVPGRLPVDATALYAKNLLTFVTTLIDAETGSLKIDWDDELVTGTGLTRGGAIVHPNLQDLAGSAPKPDPAPAPEPAPAPAPQDEPSASNEGDA